jgi:hypothetical protein
MTLKGLLHHNCFIMIILAVKKFKEILCRIFYPKLKIINLIQIIYSIYLIQKMIDIYDIFKNLILFYA